MVRAAPSSASNRSRVSTMAARFCSQTSGQMVGLPAAIRVMSRKPPAASRNRDRCSSARSRATVTSAAAVRCGTWDTTATSSSCREASIVSTSAPKESATSRTSWNAASEVLPLGVSTQTAPSKSEASAPSSPSCSEPAIGCPPTNLGSSTASTICRFTPPTSVTAARGQAARALRTSSTIEPTGVAMTTSSDRESMPVASSAPRATARAASSWSRSWPVTCHPRSRRASPTDAPMRPVPTTVARRDPVVEV